MIEWRKIVVHHSASPWGFWEDHSWKPVDVKVIRQWHLQKGWCDVGYHFVVLPNGYVQEGRSLNIKGAHAKNSGYNNIAIGICLVGDFTYYPPSAHQLIGAVQLIVRLQKKFVIKSKDVLLHHQVPGAQTACPGKLFPEKALRYFVG